MNPPTITSSCYIHKLVGLDFFGKQWHAGNMWDGCWTKQHGGHSGSHGWSFSCWPSACESHEATTNESKNDNSIIRQHLKWQEVFQVWFLLGSPKQSSQKPQENATHAPTLPFLIIVFWTQKNTGIRGFSQNWVLRQDNSTLPQVLPSIGCACVLLLEWNWEKKAGIEIFYRTNGSDVSIDKCKIAKQLHIRSISVSATDFASETRPEMALGGNVTRIRIRRLHVDRKQQPLFLLSSGPHVLICVCLWNWETKKIPTHRDFLLKGKGLFNFSSKQQRLVSQIWFRSLLVLWKTTRDLHGFCESDTDLLSFLTACDICFVYQGLWYNPVSGRSLEHDICSLRRNIGLPQEDR